MFQKFQKVLFQNIFRTGNQKLPLERIKWSF